MTKVYQSCWERSTAIAERDQLCPFPCTRRDTGELIWLVQSRSDPARYYFLTVSGDTIHCDCLQAKYHGNCAHGAAVRLALEAAPHMPLRPSCHEPEQQNPLQHARPQPRSEPRMEQESRQREAAERREQALPWTDDKPFSIWKS